MIGVLTAAVAGVATFIVAVVRNRSTAGDAPLSTTEGGASAGGETIAGDGATGGLEGANGTGAGSAV